ncbi:MAG: antibiotic biosynthesis monooxygenase family protein [Desulfobacterales bacterium]
MTVKIFIKRKFKKGTLKKAHHALNMSRYGAMEQRDYISSETLSDIEDPTRITVISMWRNREGWEAWKNSDKRKAIEAEISELTEGPAEYEHLSPGMPFEE